MTWGRRLGQFQYLRNKGAFYVETIRSWIMPAAVGGGFAKYLGIQSRWSVLVAIAIPVLVETVGAAIGWWLYHRGGVEADYQMAYRMDPYKVEQNKLLTEIRDRLPAGQK